MPDNPLVEPPPGSLRIEVSAFRASGGSDSHSGLPDMVVMLRARNQWDIISFSNIYAIVALLYMKDGAKQTILE